MEWIGKREEKNIDIELNSLLRVTLEKYKQISSPALTLFPTSDIYARPPYFIFRFLDAHKSDYEKIDLLIQNFDGQLKWVIHKSERSPKGNHVITPKECLKKRILAMTNHKSLKYGIRVN